MSRSQHPTKRTREAAQARGFRRHLFRLFEYGLWLRLQAVKVRRRELEFGARLAEGDRR